MIKVKATMAAPDWSSATGAGNVTTVTLDISKDTVQFGLRAVDQDGNRSPVAFPQVVTTQPAQAQTGRPRSRAVRWRITRSAGGLAGAAATTLTKVSLAVPARGG